MRNKNKLVLGVGINDSDDPIWIDGAIIKSYSCWASMLNRCYYQKFLVRRPTYIGCTVCEEWLSFSNFKKWFDLNYRVGCHLDKDILIQENKIYSPDTCCFVPQYLNSILTDSGSVRGELPLGVSLKLTTKRNGKQYTYYLARCNNGYGNRLTKQFKTLEEAVAWYSITKTRIVAEQVQRALSEGAIDQRVADALLARKF